MTAKAPTPMPEGVIRPKAPSAPPKPAPMRHLQGYTWINEYELVDWYTSIGKLYTRAQEPSNWILDLFKKDCQIKLVKSLTKNRMLCTEWPR